MFYLVSNRFLLNGTRVFFKYQSRNLAMAAESYRKLYVRNYEDERTLSISFNYKSQELNFSRIFNMQRDKNELISYTLSRMSGNITKVEVQKQKKKQGKRKHWKNSTENVILDPAEIDIQVLTCKNTLDENSKNIDVWIDGTVIKIKSLIYEVVVNAPTVLSLKLPSSIMIGFPVYPRCEMEFASQNECLVFWFVKKGDSVKCERVELDERHRVQFSVCRKEDLVKSDWVLVGTGWVYTPCSTELNQKLALICVPGSESKMGLPVSAESANVVSAGPGECPFEVRHLFTNCCAPVGSFRTVSYNLLADLYADSDYSREYLFPYCPPYALHIDYRKQLILKELIGYNADVMCLQEVDKKVFDHDLNPALGSLGYQGIYASKAGQVAEGEVVFYRSSKFTHKCQGDIILSEKIQEDPVLMERLDTKEEVKTVVLTKPTILQVVILESVEKPGTCLVVANTHLYFHPQAGFIRRIQAQVILRHLSGVMQKYVKEGTNVVLMLCGDFNSNPRTGTYHLITCGHLPEDFEDHPPVENEEKVDGIEFSHNMKLSSACGIPSYTNYVGGFCETLDYIFIEKDKLDVEQVIPMPSHEEVTLQTALPSVVFPSDHIALVCDLSLIHI